PFPARVFCARWFDRALRALRDVWKDLPLFLPSFFDSRRGARMSATLVSGLRSSELCLGFHPAAEHFGHAPGLSDAAARSMRLFGVEEFADRAQAGLIEVSREGLEEMPCLLMFVRVKLCPGIEE